MLKAWGWVACVLGGATAASWWLYGLDIAAEARRTGDGQFRSSWTHMTGWHYPHTDASGRVVLELEGDRAEPLGGSAGQKGLQVAIDGPAVIVHHGLEALALVPEDRDAPLYARARQATAFAEAGDAASARFTGAVTARRGRLHVATEELGLALPSGRELEAWARKHLAQLAERIRALPDAAARAELEEALAAIEAAHPEPRDRVDAIARAPRFAVHLGALAAMSTDPREHLRIEAPGPVTLRHDSPALVLVGVGLDVEGTESALRLGPPVAVELDAALLFAQAGAGADGGAPEPPGPGSFLQPGDRIIVRSAAPVEVRGAEGGQARRRGTAGGGGGAAGSGSEAPAARAEVAGPPRRIELRFTGAAEATLIPAPAEALTVRDLRPLRAELLAGGTIRLRIPPPPAEETASTTAPVAPTALASPPAPAIPPAPGAAAEAPAPAPTRARRGGPEDADVLIERGVRLHRADRLIAVADEMRWQGAEETLVLAGGPRGRTHLLIERSALADAAADAEGEVRDALGQEWWVDADRVEVTLGREPRVEGAREGTEGAGAEGARADAAEPRLRRALERLVLEGRSAPAILVSRPHGARLDGAGPAPARSAAAGDQALGYRIEGARIALDRPDRRGERVTVEPLAGVPSRQRVERPVLDAAGALEGRDSAEAARLALDRRTGLLTAEGEVALERRDALGEPVLAARGERLVLEGREVEAPAEPRAASGSERAAARGADGAPAARGEPGAGGGQEPPRTRFRPESITLTARERDPASVVEVTIHPDRMGLGSEEAGGAPAPGAGPSPAPVPAAPPDRARAGAAEGAVGAKPPGEPDPPVKLVGRRVWARFEAVVRPAAEPGGKPRPGLRVAEATASAEGSADGRVRVVPASDLPPDDRFLLEGARLVYRAARGGSVTVEGSPGTPPSFAQGEASGSGAFTRLVAPEASLDLLRWEVRLAGGLDLTLRAKAKPGPGPGPATGGAAGVPAPTSRLRARAATVAIDPPRAGAADERTKAPSGPLGRVERLVAEGDVIYEGQRPGLAGGAAKPDRITCDRAEYDRAAGTLILTGEPMRTADGQTLRRLVIRY